MANEFANVSTDSLDMIRRSLADSLGTQREALKERFGMMLTDKSGKAWDSHGARFRALMIEYQNTCVLLEQARGESQLRKDEE